MFDFDPDAYETERQALAAYHQGLDELDEDAVQFALRNGFVPTDRAVLIEAGTRCLPLLGTPSIDAEPGKSALARLESIMVRLWTQRDAEEVAHVLQEWERYIAREKRTARSDTTWGCVLILAMIAGVLGVVWWLFV